MTTEAKPQGEAPKLDDSAILAKAERGEKLTPEEENHIAGAPNLERSPEPARKEEENEEEPGAEDPAPQEGEEETPEGDKPEGEEEAEGEEPEGDEKPEEEEPAEEPAPEKPAKGPAAKKQTPEERRKLIDAELDKPDEQVDLTQFTPVEVGLYWDLKKQRRKNNSLDAENRRLRFEKIQRELKERGEDGEEEDPLEGREDEDVLTVADVKKILAKQAKKPAHGLITTTDIRAMRAEADSKLRSKGITDFNDVVDLAKEALEGDEDARLELQETAIQGGNVALKTYWLIKGSKKWPEIEKRLKPAEKKEGDSKPPAGGSKKQEDDTARRLRQNGAKVRTSGSSGGGTAQPGEYTVEDVMRMSPAEFGRLPKAKQDALLWKFGSDPNLDR